MSPTEFYTAATLTRDESIGYLINAARARVGSALDKALEPLDVTMAQWGTLMSVKNGAQTAVDTCRLLGCDTGSMTRMIDRLEEKGLLRRERSTADRRVVLLVLTPTGDALCVDAKPLVAEVFNHLLRDFSRDEFDSFKFLLRKLIASND
jgi:DNA-binding MarR family transcriptional regulator